MKHLKLFETLYRNPKFGDHAITKGNFDEIDYWHKNKKFEGHIEEPTKEELELLAYRKELEEEW